MTIEAITQEEFGKVADTRAAPFGNAVRALAPGAGVKTTCTWHHSGSTCSGTSLAHQAAKRRGFKVRTTCRDGTVYVFRPSRTTTSPPLTPRPSTGKL